MRSRAFTLIELLVVISVTSIVFGVGVAGYREFSRRQALTGTLKNLKSDLRLAQQLALTGQKPENTSCPQLSGYKFIVNGQSNYSIVALCDGVSAVTLKSVDLSENNTISSGNVIFKVLGQGTNLSSPLTFTVSSVASGTSGSVIVGIGGDVQ